MKKQDLTGHVYSRLTVLSEIARKGQNRRWLCQCSCGTTIKVHHTSLRSGNTRSCGCLRRELLTTHGDSQNSNRLYRIWCDMKSRCLDSKHPSYPIYGNRGITICDNWMDYSEFRSWALQNGYFEELTIERIENNDGYKPENCTWATWSTQMRNKRKKTGTTSKYIGVSYDKAKKKWAAYIQDQGKCVKLGYFINEDLAAGARDNYIIINKLSGYKLNLK